MSIEPLFNFEIKIENKKLLCICEATGVEFTELRMISLIQDIDNFFKSLYHDKIKKYYFVFKLTKLPLPKNLTLIKELSDTFRKHVPMLVEKLEFSIVEVDNEIFRLYFSVFKMYYEPKKTLYMCKNQDEIYACLHDPSSRSSFYEIKANEELKDL